MQPNETTATVSLPSVFGKFLFASLVDLVDIRGPESAQATSFRRWTRKPQPKGLKVCLLGRIWQEQTNWRKCCVRSRGKGRLGREPVSEEMMDFLITLANQHQPHLRIPPFASCKKYFLVIVASKVSSHISLLDPVDTPLGGCTYPKETGRDSEIFPGAAPVP